MGSNWKTGGLWREVVTCAKEAGLAPGQEAMSAASKDEDDGGGGSVGGRGGEATGAVGRGQAGI